MYNRLYNHLEKTNILYSKKFGFQKGHSTEYAKIQLIDQISNSLKTMNLLLVYLLIYLQLLISLITEFF